MLAFGKEKKRKYTNWHALLEECSLSLNVGKRSTEINGALLNHKNKNASFATESNRRGKSSLRDAAPAQLQNRVA